MKRERARIERLLWRAGFGPRPGDVERLAARGLEAAIDELLDPSGPQLSGRPPRIEGKPLDPKNVWADDILWWLDRTVRTRQPLAERMTLNWHDHFAVSNSKVGDVRMMLRYYAALRRHSLGRFRELARAMTLDGAMQIFLDLANSSDSSPNENYARELLELFTLGVNNGYDERDVREASRALTGFTFDWDTKRFAYDPKRHDGGLKSVLGKRGRFEPLDIVDIAIERPEHARYLCEKIWGYLSPRTCPPRLLARMVRAYRDSHTDVRPPLRLALSHAALYTDLDEPHQVKPPVVYVAGMLRATGKGVEREEWRWVMGGMGQEPFYPPNVSGWEGDEAWLTTGTVRGRYVAASVALGDEIKEGSIPRTQTPAQALRSALEATGRPWCSPRTMTVLRGYSRRSVAGKDEGWQVKHYWPERQRVLRHLLLAGPDAQVC